MQFQAAAGIYVIQKWMCSIIGGKKKKEHNPAMSCVCYNATARCRGRNSVKVESRTFQRGFIWEYARKRPVGCFMTRLERRHFAVQSMPSGRQDNFKLQLQSKAKTTLYLFFCFWFFFEVVLTCADFSKGFRMTTLSHIIHSCATPLCCEKSLWN